VDMFQPYICHGRLASIIPDQARTRPHRANGCDIDDTPTTSLFHRGDRGRYTQKDTLDIDAHDLVEFGLGDLERGLVLVTRACVVDEDVQSAELAHRGVNHLLPVPLHGDVGRQSVHVLVVLRVGGESLLQALGVHVGGDDLRALFDEFLRAGKAEA